MTPATVHHGRAESTHTARSAVLAAAYAATPERFVRRAPTPPPIPTAAWINKPNTDEAAHQIRTPTVSSRLTGSAEPLPHFVAPMLLETARPAPPDDGSWAVEVKFDGIRAQLRVEGRNGWSVRSRPGRNCTPEFPELAAAADALGRHAVVLDGELVHFAADGLPDFGALRRRLTSHGARAAAEASARTPATLVVFDVLHLDGRPVRALPYRRRRELLAELLADDAGCRLAPAWTDRFDDVLAVTREHGLEGVVFKRLEAPTGPANVVPRGASSSTAETRRCPLRRGVRETVSPTPITSPGWEPTASRHSRALCSSGSTHNDANSSGA